MQPTGSDGKNCSGNYLYYYYYIKRIFMFCINRYMEKLAVGILAWLIMRFEKDISPRMLPEMHTKFIKMFVRHLLKNNL